MARRSRSKNALKAGFDGHVAKPVDREHLIASIAAAMHLGNGSST